MKNLSSSTSGCRRCQFYTPEGRRGGHCQQLNVAVQGAWTACALASPPFSPAWESFEAIMAWQQKTLAAMQASAESTMTEVLSEIPQPEVSQSALQRETSSSYESTSLSSAGELTERSSSVAISQMPQDRTAAPVSMVGIKALWM